MKNLKLLSVVNVADSDLANSQRICWDSEMRTLYCASSTALFSCEPHTRQVEKLASLAEEGHMPADGSGRIVGMHFHSFANTICLACSNGNLLVWNIAMRELECVGTVESGLTAMSWSPDLELLVLATGHETLILMNQEFETIIEVSQHPSDLGEAEPITVGWGKKETQFHGSEGKTAAKKKVEGMRPAFDWDDKLPRISWSGEGKLFMVSSINPDTGARKLNVWTPEGVHHAVSEPVDGLEHSLAWRPSSNKAVSTQMRPNSHDVVFFESNGLRHREFSLPFQPNQMKVRELAWNSTGSLLLVWAEEMTPHNNGSPATHVQLWSTGNYHWYLKQSLEFPASLGVSHLQWDPELAHTLHLLTCDGQYLQYTWTLATNHSQGGTADDLATVAVIDGRQVLGTPFRQMVVPPPMSGYSLPLPSSANALTFAPNPRPNDLAILLADNTVAIYRSKASDQPGEKDKNGFRQTCQTPELEGVMRLEFPKDLAQFPLCAWHLTWVTSDLFVVCGLDSHAGSPVLCTARLDAQAGLLTVSSTLELEDPVCAVAVGPSTGSVAVQLESGTILRFDPESESLLPWETKAGMTVSFPCSCPTMGLAVLDREEVVIGLTDRYQLYINDIQVMRDCTSFSVHDEFLLLTTLKHTLRCVSLHTRIADLSQLSAEKTLPFDESIRRVERGSQLVVAVPCDTRVVLQMPRGNLEGVHPRALVLSAVRRHLDRLEFGKAFRLMKTHRINLNLLHDHSPETFLAHVKDFITQVDSVNNINIFLTDLQEEDVTSTMYSAAYPKTQAGESGERQASKVDTVCDAVRTALEEVDKNKYLLSVLTAYVRKRTPELENALKEVQGLRERGGQAVSAEEALKYLLFLVDVNELYDVALGTYNFDLVLMVAEKSQKNPQEYIPFLNDLRRLEENYRKYSVDKHLKHYAKALVHISKCPDHFQECLLLVKTHKLYSNALRLFPPGSPENRELAVCYAEHLLERSKPGEAALMFSRAGELSRALEAFVSCHNWRQAFCMAAWLQYTQAQTVELAQRLADQLKALNKHYDAAIVYEQYANDVEEAIASLIEGAQWDEAQRLMHKTGRLDFEETHLLGALRQAAEQHQEAMAEARSELSQHSQRLATVRQLKLQQQQQLEFLESESRLNTADADLFSDTSSAMGDSVSGVSNRSSLISRTTGHSTRSRRKAEQKKWSLKKGSPHEDLALVAALSKLIERIDSWREEVGALLQALVQHGMDEEAESLQTTYDSLIELVKKLTPEIWKDDPSATVSTQPQTFGPGSTANSIAQAMQQGTPLQSEEKLDPILVVPPKLRKEVHWRLHTSQPLAN